MGTTAFFAIYQFGICHVKNSLLFLVCVTKIGQGHKNLGNCATIKRHCTKINGKVHGKGWLYQFLFVAAAKYNECTENPAG